MTATHDANQTPNTPSPMDAFGEYMNELMRQALVPPFDADMQTKVMMALRGRNILQDVERIMTDPAPPEWLMTDDEQRLIKHAVTALFNNGMFYVFMQQLHQVMVSDDDNEQEYIAKLGVLWCEMVDKAMRIGFSVSNQMAMWDGRVTMRGEESNDDNA